MVVPIIGTTWYVMLPVLLFSAAIFSIIWITDHKSKSNRAFLVLVTMSVVWGFLSALSFASSSQNLTRITSDLASAASFLLLLTIFIFSEYYFLGRMSSWVKRFLLPLSVPLVVLFSSSYTCGTINSQNNCSGGPSYTFLIAVIILLFGLTLRNGFQATRSADKLAARQARFIVYGLAVSVGLGILLAYVFPKIGISYFNNLYPATPMIFIGFVFYAIIKHRLFDVRLLVIRSLGYVISLIAMAALYGFLVLGIIANLLDVRLPINTQIILSLVTALASLGFPYLRKVFDKTSNRLFYRDAYDPQELFDSLNKVLVSSLDLQYLMTESISVLETALKPEYLAIGLRNGADSQRIFSSRKLNFSNDVINHARRLTPKVHHKVIAADYLEEPRQTELKKLMTEHNVAVLVRLAQDVRKTEEGLGYIVLGPRKSGNQYSQRDIQVLDTVANMLVIAIQNALHYEEIQQFNLTLQAKVDDATRKLRANNEKLKTLDETKDDFISMASHQLRTPLTSVKGYISMVLEGDAGKINDTQRKMLGQAFVSSQRMVYLIADLLNVSRLRTGKFVIEPSATNLATMVSEEIDQLVETAASRSIELTYQKPANYPTLMLDETKTRQVIMNFIDNAIYYTPSGGHITVELSETPHTADLRVIDDGIGVPATERHHLFTKFYRAKNAQKARPDGTGLGLFMAKKVVLAQGGSIIFESKEGEGSVFGFSFPKNKLAVVAGSAPNPVAAAISVKKPRKVPAKAR